MLKGKKYVQDFILQMDRNCQNLYRKRSINIYKWILIRTKKIPGIAMNFESVDSPSVPTLTNIICTNTETRIHYHCQSLPLRSQIK